MRDQFVWNKYLFFIATYSLAHSLNHSLPLILSLSLSLFGLTSQPEPRPPHCRRFWIEHNWTHMPDMSLNEWSARAADASYTINNKYKRRKTINGIRTRVFSNQAPADARLRPHGHWGSVFLCYYIKKEVVWVITNSLIIKPERGRDFPHVTTRIQQLHYSLSHFCFVFCFNPTKFWHVWKHQ
jgi:hypothetical protein